MMHHESDPIGAVSPEEAVLVDDRVQAGDPNGFIQGDEYDEDDEDYDETPRRADPLVRWMSVVSLLLIIVIAGTTIAIVYFLLGMRGAPRTAVEREVYIKEAYTKEKPDDIDGWLNLAYAYMNAEQFADARDAIEQGASIKKTAGFTLAAADLERLEGNAEQSIAQYNAAERLAKGEMETARKQMIEKQVSMPPSPRVLIEVYVGRSKAYQELGKHKDAIADLKRVVGYDKTDAYAWGELGTLYAKTGDEKAARQAYETALKYFPDYEPALTGLQKLEGE